MGYLFEVQRIHNTGVAGEHSYLYELRAGGVSWSMPYPGADWAGDFLDAREARLIEVSRRCPPEDCGGPWGYGELLEAIKDPKHERHAQLTEWIGDNFDPDAVDLEWFTAEVAALAKSGHLSQLPTGRAAPDIPRPSPEGRPANAQVHTGGTTMPTRKST